MAISKYEKMEIPLLRDDISNSAAEFSKALTDLNNAFKVDTSTIIRSTVLRVFRNIIKRSPVKTGSYRASHAIANFEPASSNGIVIKIKGRDKKGSQKATMTVIKEAWTWKVGDGSIWMYNNLPYAQRIENGWSTKVPDGVYRVALREVAGFLNARVAKAKGFSSTGRD